MAAEASSSLGTISNEKPTLLTIPTEIRLQILRYTLQPPGREYDKPKIVSVYWPPAFLRPSRYKPPFYGTAEMSKLFTISRELHDELEGLLYTQFVFFFPHFLRLESVRDFINPLSTRAKGLLREIKVPINLNFGLSEAHVAHTADQIRHKREAFEYMQYTLTGLRKVHIYIIFVGGPGGGSMVKQREDEFADLVMGLVSIFAPKLEVVLLNRDKQQCRVDIMRVCQGRLVELLSGSQCYLSSKMGQVRLRS